MANAQRSLLLAGVTLWPATSWAQAVPSAAQCRDFLSSTFLVTLEAPATRVTGTAPDTCRYDGVLATAGGRTGFRADRLTVAGIGFDPNATRGPPMTLRAEALGVGWTVRTGDGNLEWMLAQQRGPGFAVTLDLTFDPTARVMTLRELSLDGERIGRVVADGEVGDVKPINVLVPSGVDQLVVRRLRLRIDSQSFIASYLLSPFIATLPASGSVVDTQAEVERRLAQAKAGAATLLRAAGASAGTVAAVDGMIADLPHPKHPFEFRASASPPPTLVEMESASGSVGEMAALAKRITVEATYAGAFRP